MAATMTSSRSLPIGHVVEIVADDLHFQPDRKQVIAHPLN